jgi:hypothetical protein
MKLYKKRPDKIIRVNIIRPGSVTKHIAFHECELVECFNELMAFVHTHIDGDKKTMLQCREWINSKNGASMSFSFMGGNLDAIEDLINKHFN